MADAFDEFLEGIKQKKNTKEGTKETIARIQHTGSLERGALKQEQVGETGTISVDRNIEKKKEKMKHWTCPHCGAVIYEDDLEGLDWMTNVYKCPNCGSPLLDENKNLLQPESEKDIQEETTREPETETEWGEDENEDLAWAAQDVTDMFQPDDAKFFVDMHGNPGEDNINDDIIGMYITAKNRKDAARIYLERLLGDQPDVLDAFAKYRIYVEDTDDRHIFDFEDIVSETYSTVQDFYGAPQTAVFKHPSKIRTQFTDKHGNRRWVIRDKKTGQFIDNQDPSHALAVDRSIDAKTKVAPGYGFAGDIDSGGGKENKIKDGKPKGAKTTYNIYFMKMKDISEDVFSFDKYGERRVKAGSPEKAAEIWLNQMEKEGFPWNEGEIVVADTEDEFRMPVETININAGGNNKNIEEYGVFRTMLNRPSNKEHDKWYYVERYEDGRFKNWVETGRSIKADKARDAKNVPSKPGQGHLGDYKFGSYMVKREGKDWFSAEDIEMNDDMYNNKIQIGDGIVAREVDNDIWHIYEGNELIGSAAVSSQNINDNYVMKQIVGALYGKMGENGERGHISENEILMEDIGPKIEYSPDTYVSSRVEKYAQRRYPNNPEKRSRLKELIMKGEVEIGEPMDKKEIQEESEPKGMSPANKFILSTAIIGLIAGGSWAAIKKYGKR